MILINLFKNSPASIVYYRIIVATFIRSIWNLCTVTIDAFQQLMFSPQIWHSKTVISEFSGHHFYMWRNWRQTLCSLRVLPEDNKMRVWELSFPKFWSLQHLDLFTVFIFYLLKWTSTFRSESAWQEVYWVPLPKSTDFLCWL